MAESMTNFHLILPLVLAPAIILGQLFRLVGLPAVVGQILAGVLLGPMVLGLVVPGEFHGEEGHGNGSGFYQLAEIGLCVLLFKIGVETRLSHFTLVWKRALGVALAGMILPLGFGVGAGILLGWSLQAALFLGAALTATSIGVTVSVIEEMGVQDSSEARVIMGAAVVDDILGLLLLSTITALSVKSESIGLSMGRSLIQAVFFLGAAIAAGPFVVRFFNWLTASLRSEAVLVVLAFSYLLVMAHFAENVGLAGIIGSYAAGLVFSIREEIPLERAFKPLTEILTPIFFVLIGSSIEFRAIEMQTVGAVALILAIAMAGKLLAPWMVPRFGLRRGMVGSGLVPRGEVGLVFAQVGLGSLALSQGQYSVLTIVLVATTILGPMCFQILVRKYGTAPT